MEPNSRTDAVPLIPNLSVRESAHPPPPIGGSRGRKVNRWKIPDWLENEVKDRDKSCVYCRVEFGPATASRKSMATWEHIVNDAKIINRENIARCCFPCNSSKGTKELSDWLESDYCKKRGITKDTVADVIKRALVSRPSISDNGG
jgi:hypothetical protein